MSALSGCLGLDVIKSLRKDPPLDALLNSIARYFFPAIQPLIRSCVRARKNLRSEAFDSKARERDIIRDLIREDIFIDTLFPTDALERIQKFIGACPPVRTFLSPRGSARQSNSFFRGKSSFSRSYSNTRRTPYAPQHNNLRIHNYQHNLPSACGIPF